MVIPPHQPIPLYLVFEQLLDLEVYLQLSRNLLVEGEALVIKNRRPLMIPDIYEHISVCKILSMALDQH